MVWHAFELKNCLFELKKFRKSCRKKFIKIVWNLQKNVQEPVFTKFSVGPTKIFTNDTEKVCSLV